MQQGIRGGGGGGKKEGEAKIVLRTFTMAKTVETNGTNIYIHKLIIKLMCDFVQYFNLNTFEYIWRRNYCVIESSEIYYVAFTQLILVLEKIGTKVREISSCAQSRNLFAHLHTYKKALLLAYIFHGCEFT